MRLNKRKSLDVNIRSPCLWNQLPLSLRQPHSGSSSSTSDSPISSPVTYYSFDSPLCSSISPSLFQPWLKTYLFHKSYPRSFTSSSGLLSQTITQTVSSELLVFMAALCNRAGHYIFALWFLLLSFSCSFFSSSPNLSRRRLDVYHTSTQSVALARI